MTVVAPAVAERFRPGQFVAVAVGGEHTSLLARRCLPVYEVKSDYGGTVEFVFEADDPGSRWLASRRSRDALDLIGPLGRPFPLPRDPASCLLVGGAHGSSGLFALADTLRQRDCKVHFVLAAPHAHQVYGALSAQRIGDSSTVITRDGSLGVAGMVPDLLPGIIDQTEADVVYAAGPTSLLSAVSGIASALGIPCQVSLGELLSRTAACGIGVCASCVLPVVGDDGHTRMVRACAEGPVLRGERVRWGDLGTIPLDALGGPRAPQTPLEAAP
ncbi:dihydroorotate dehydrogenase electron transfer subunit [Actinocorallia sp. API 0066]|uniref:iron-sulfur cluster-binding protein n=1 Tax=Actinocorallia sp. API 0066 TaxID=2896846 RepID=UPI001E382512|nr:dihydroorotate dehydrogenase electron transfer subunit [Actinocorallia sp. API 0066]MCD0450931.1 dihydroorotate dehydrogenase electron transfer subunit [Actinocorallia sp. API 0066]